MWSQILLCLLVGTALAANPGWRDQTQYKYHIRARTLSSLHEVSKDYTGTIIKAKMTIQPLGEKLYARIEDPKYAQVHTKLSTWSDFVPDEKLSFKSLEFSGKPFQIVMRDGVIRDLIVSRDVPNWEANMLKGIVSQLQLDTNAVNMIESPVNNPPNENQETATYLTLEDTVTGTTETLYNVNEFPEYIMQSKSYLVPLPHLKGTGKIIEVVKSKNYSRVYDRPMYNYGFDGLRNTKPGLNQVGEILSRTSVSYAVVTGHLRRYTVQSSHTVNKIVVSPTLYDKQKGSVVSMVNITLESVQANTSTPSEINEPISLGTLVYSYNKPGNNKVYPREPRTLEFYRHSDSIEERYRSARHVRSVEDNGIRGDLTNEDKYDTSSFEESTESIDQYQEEVDLETAPMAPLLPFAIAFQGSDIKTVGGVNLEEKASQLAREIAEDMENQRELAAKDTLAKYILLTTLTRSMSKPEIQNVATNLYHIDNQGKHSDAWEVYRDAVAEAGTGPALLAIGDWIINKKLDKYEAADVISTMSSAVRVPSLKYMEKFFELVKDEEIRKQNTLNDTALLAFTSLIHRVYVNREESHNMYPVHSYGKFYNREGNEFMRSEVIPWLAQQLEEAILQADSVRIQVYIRALGNVGDRKILEVFEPYLEGKKQVSQFQRVMMVICLDNLVKAHPRLARSVLYKIYQNRGDIQEIRVAAVHQFLRAYPPTDVLQRMAMDTNIDTNEQVNAAIKSAIETASKLEGDEFKPLRDAAQAAKPLLTKKEYGIQYSKEYLHSYVVEQMKLTYKQSISMLADENTYLPKGFKYSLRANLGEYREHRFLIEEVVSSVDELIHVFQRQFKEHKEQEQQSKSGDPSNFSSKIASVLNMAVREHEQLEGNIHLKFGDFHRFFAYNNQTIQQLPQVVREIEGSLKKGKNLHYKKIINQEEKALSYPTEMGVPFIYTYDVPTMMSVDAALQVLTKPSISNGEYLTYPDTVESSWEIRSLLYRKVRGQIGFFTPYDSLHYLAGFDKNLQIEVPLRGKLHVDIKEQLYELEFEPANSERNTQVFHYSSWPYVATRDLLKVIPNSEWTSAHNIIYKGKEHKMEFVLGRGTPGLVFRVDVSSDEAINAVYLYRKFNRHDVISGLMSYGLDENIEYTNINVEYAGDMTTSRKVLVTLGLQDKYLQEAEETDRSAHLNDFNSLPSAAAHSSERQREFMSIVASGIHSAQIKVVDATVEFPGQQNVKYVTTAAFARSDVDPKSRGLIYSEGYFNNKRHQFALFFKNHFPNTDGLDPEYAMTFDPTASSHIQMAFGENFEGATKLSARVQWKKTHARAQYLETTNEYKICREQMQQSNSQLPACANLTQEANLMDKVQAEIHYEHVNSIVFNYTAKTLSALKYVWYYNIDSNVADARTGLPAGQAQIDAIYSPDLKSVDVVVKTQYEEHHINDVKLNDWTKRVFVVHPVFNFKSRVMGRALGLQTFRPICVLDKTSAVTFDNVTYPLHLGSEKAWYLMFQHIRPQARHEDNIIQQEPVQEQIKHQVHKYEVFVRRHPQDVGKKEVNIVVNMPATEYKPTQIKLLPTNQNSGSIPRAKVLVNNQELPYDDKKSAGTSDGAIQIYALPNGEVKVDITDVFYVIYDGVRVKITTVNDEIRGSIAGLCGNFNGEKSDELRAPKNCILRDFSDFITAYEINTQTQSQLPQKQSEIYKPGKCIRKQIHYSNVISDIDAGRRKHYSNTLRRSQNTERKTTYVTEDGSICFSIHPITKCKKGYRLVAHSMKNIPVHCVQKSNVATLWRNQIDEGTHLDFTRKPATKTIKMEVATECTN